MFQALRAQIATVKKNLAADLASAGTDSAALENLKTKVLADPGLTGDARTATMIALREVELNAELIQQQADELKAAQLKATPTEKPATLPAPPVTTPTAPSITAPMPAVTPAVQPTATPVPH